jgi:hypothetical protein
LHQLSGTKLDGKTGEAAIKLIEKAREKGQWLVFASHETYSHGDPLRLITELSTLEAICKYARDPANGIWIDNVHNIAEYVIGKKKEISECYNLANK